jgi:hypothetical protein
MRQESLPTSTSERQERQGKFPSDCEKMFFKGSNYNRVSTNVFAMSQSIHSCVSQDPTRATHRFIINDQFGCHRLARTSIPSKCAHEVNHSIIINVVIDHGGCCIALLLQTLPLALTRERGREKKGKAFCNKIASFCSQECNQQLVHYTPTEIPCCL